MYRWINPSKILVRVNRQKQKEKRERKGLIIVDPKNAFFRHNQQHGEIIMIGKKMQEYQPELQPGDTLLFSHFIEGSVETKQTGEQKDINNEYMIHQDEEWRYYLVGKDMYFAVVKDTGEILVNENIIFARPASQELDNRNVVKKGKIFTFANYVETRQSIEERIEELKNQSMRHSRTAFGQQAKRLAMMEMEKLTRELNKKRFAAFHPTHTHRNFSIDCGFNVNESDTLLYMLLGNQGIELQVSTIDWLGKEYSILRTPFVYGVIKGHHPTQSEINRRFERNFLRNSFQHGS